MVRMVIRERTSIFREDLCDLCGECLHQCPVLHLPYDEAKKEVKRLIDGEESQYALSKCNTCFSCNIYCPQNANPYQLILERWNDAYKKGGAPPLYKFVCPTEEPNIWQLLNLFLSEKEKKWILKWVTYTPKPGDRVLLIGNYTHLFPFIIGGSHLLDNFVPISRVDQWEGGAYLYQGGYLDVVQKIAQRCKQDFERWGIKQVAHTLDAVEYIFSEVHPKEMGVIHTPAIINFNEWIIKKVRTGDITIKNKLNLKVTIHDNCYSKCISGKYWSTPRELLKLCGCDVKEMRHIKKDSLCCGFGAGASWVKNIAIPFDIISEGIKKFREAEATGANALISYCGGCIYLLWATKVLMNSKINLYHLIEVVRMGMGEDLNYPEDHISRAWDIIAIITYQLIVSMFQKNFYIKKITYDKKMSTFWPKKYLLLRFMRKLLDIYIIKWVFSKFFLSSIRFMKTR
ncbi:MAG: 4Fe-4S dicluster domain-containing protein [Candidatus Lokiarchaeota archaeon]|nr:4Fe-4S dicluster domain-containing protein [Candidatus Lokiarchaeota archaeon]MBD3339763.1 4Fe-4S dicluster domain-containing protein [Candidatus Lokiarchaeota archaeon]